MRATRVLVIALPFAAALGAGCKGETRTMLVVEIDSNLSVPNELTKIEVVVKQGGKVQQFPFSLEGQQYALPLRVGLVAAADPTNQGTDIVASGFLGDVSVVSEGAIVGFLDGQSMLLRLFLARECIANTCEFTQTCTRGGRCRPKARTVAELEPFSPAAPRQASPDAGDAMIALAVDATDHPSDLPDDSMSADGPVFDAGGSMDSTDGSADGSTDGGIDSGTDARDAGGIDGGTCGAGAGTWKKEGQLPQANDLLSIWGASSRDVWAVGYAGTIVHWNGSAWSKVASGTTQGLYGVWGSESNNVWAVGEDKAFFSTIVHWNGAAWSTVVSGYVFTGPLRSIWGSASNDIWAVGDSGSIVHWNGMAWSSVTNGTANAANCALWGVWGSGAGDVWAVGFCGIIHWNGTTWSNVASGNGALSGVWGSGANDVWATIGNFAGNFGIIHWNGTTWSGVASGTATTQFNGVWGNGPGDVWAVGAGGAITHWNGAAWSNVAAVTTNNLKAVWGTCPNDVWAVGALGTVVHYRP